MAKRKNEGDEQSEYQQTHQTIKRRISESELENSSISSSPTPSFEPMDLSGSKSYTPQWARKFKNIQAKKTREIK